MTHEFAITLWERALAEDIGVILTLATERDKRAIEGTLYEARKLAGNPELETLMIAKPGDNPLELWIVKKMTDMEDVV